METPSILEKMECVRLVLDNSQEQEPRVESARVTVTLTDGQEHQIFIQHVLGFPAKPMSRSDVIAKAENLLEPKLGLKRTSELIDRVLNIEELDDIRKIIPMLNPDAN
jgi:2-methylcitrate dehydratase PrpD